MTAPSRAVSLCPEKKRAAMSWQCVRLDQATKNLLVRRAAVARVRAYLKESITGFGAL